MRNLLIILAVGCICYGCNPCKRIVKHHPNCFSSNVITIHDTTKIPGAKADTVFSSKTVKDTVVLQKNRLTVKYYQSHDTVFLSGECKDTVITKEIRVPVVVPSVQGSVLPWWAYVLAGCALLYLAIWIRYRR